MHRRIVYIIALLLIAQLAVGQTVGRYEYWVDNDYTGKTTGYGTQADGTLNLSVDMNSLNVGPHFLYFRAYNSNGQVSKINQWLFFRPASPEVAPGLSGFEYWIDNDYAGRTRTLSGNTTQSFTIDVSEIAPGAHLLYYREANQAGIYGQIKSLLFYISPDSETVSGLSGFEYWIDNDYAGRTRTSSGNATQSFTVDVSDIAPGMHFLFFREMNQAGIYGQIKSLLFFKSSDPDFASGLSGFEYWIDNDYAGRTRTLSGNTTQSFTVDVSDIAPGAHFLYYREANQAGIYGQIRSMLFYKQFETDADYEITGYEYWIDNDYSGRTVSYMAPDSPEYIFVDVDGLKQGLHQFNYRTLTGSGVASGIKSWLFYVPDYDNMEVVDDSPMVGYRFNFNGVSEYVEFEEEYDDYEMRDFTFDIPELTQMAKVDDDCSFTFNTENDSVVMTRNTKVGFGLQFKTKAGGWSAPVTYGYEEKDTIRRKAVPLALQQTVTFDKRNRGDFDVFRIEVEKSGQYYLSASQSCRILLYSTKDGSLYNTIEPSSVTSPYRMALSKGASYYGVVTDEVTDDANGADVISVRYMQNLNFVPTPVIDYADETVTLSCENANATIYYTIDGSDPTESSSVYTGPFEFKHNGVIKVVAKYQGLADSYIVVQKVNSYTVQKPVISFHDLQVYISTATESARIYYTTDGSDPLSGGTLYSGPFSVIENCTVRAAAKRDDYNPSATASQFINVSSVKCAVPTFSVTDNKLTIATQTEGASIWYTMDGSEPTEQSSRYTAPVQLEMNGKIRAFVTKSGSIQSSVSEYTVDWFRLDAPVMSFNEQTGLVTITASRSEALIYYVIGGGIPTADSTLYTEPFLLDHNDTIIAFGVCEHFNDSWPDTLVVNSYKVAAPVVSRVNGKMEMSCSTEGSKIYYTIDGSDPDTINGTLYSGPVAIDVICTMKVMAVKTGFNNSNIVNYDLGKCSAPVFECVDNVLTMATTTADASIFYTLDGTVPDIESTVYANPIRLERNMKVNAVAVKDDMVNSDVSVYTVDWFTVDKPEFAFTEGILAITCATPGSTIHYVIGDTEPDTTWAVYTAPIVLTDNKVIKAFAVKADFNESETGSYTPEYFTCDAPVISRVDGKMQISCATDGAEIRYTTDGSDPLIKGKVYSDPLTIDVVCTIRAVAVKSYFNNSVYASYELNKCVIPRFACTDNILTITTATSDASVYYTVDGSVPGTSSTLYTAPVRLEYNQKVRAYAVRGDMIDSEVSDYVVDWFTVAKPEFVFTEGILAITCATPGSVIHYEIGGAAPGAASAVYSAPIVLTDNKVIKAYAVKTDFNDSEVGIYEPDYFKCSAPVISFDGHQVTMRTATDNSSIYFTLDGKVPDQSSERYIGARLLDGLCTVKAYTVRDNFIDSECSEFILPSYYNGDAVYIQEPGAISKAFEWCGTDDLTELYVYGNVNSKDFSFIRGNRGLKYLDMSRALTDSLPDGALSGTGIVSFSTPANVKWAGENILKDCEAIAAVQWNSDIMVPDNLLGGTQKPNMLLYVKSGSYVRAGAFVNVIVNGITEQLTLTDSETSDFWCPVAFTARKATYTHTYTMKTEKGQCTGWESIALPFTVSTITHAKNGAMAPFGVDTDNDKPFWLEKLTENGFVPAQMIEANTPYIICMPNNDIYADKYILAGEVTFQATNVIVEATNDIKVSSYGGLEFAPNYSNGTSNGRSVLNVGIEYQGHKQGSLFVGDLRRLKPFEAYVISRSGASRALIRDMLNTNTTIVNDIFMEEVDMSKRGVYDLSGRKLSDDPDYRPASDGTPVVLIINGVLTVIR